MHSTISIAIETSCRKGGVALGIDDTLAASIEFDASSRHAAHLVARLDELLAGQGLAPSAITEIYVSAGPGSFTGVRVGVTVARTLAQALPQSRCLAVPSTLATAYNAIDLDWTNLAVLLDAKDELFYAQLYARELSGIAPAGPPAVQNLADFLSATPRPLLVTGEGLLYHPVSAGGVTMADPSIYYPTAAAVWHAGRQLARQERFVEYNHLLPLYARKSEAERLWELKHPQNPA